MKRRAIGIMGFILAAALLWATRDALATRLGRGSVDARLTLRLGRAGVTQLDFCLLYTSRCV